MRQRCFSLCLGWAGAACVAIGVATQAHAVPLAFPADQSLVPLAVGAAFALPALIAGAIALVMRAGSRLGPVAGTLMLAAAGVALAGYLYPELAVSAWSLKL